MIFSKAEEEPTKEPEKDIPETEISETRYMGEGPPGVTKKGETEIAETAYMGEPEERTESKHEKEYKRTGKQQGRRATLEPRHKHAEGKKEKPA
jgi:hypothetical protein